MWSRKLNSYDRQFFEWYLKYKCDKKLELKRSIKYYDEYEDYMDAMLNRFPVEWSAWKLNYEELKEERDKEKV